MAATDTLRFKASSVLLRTLSCQYLAATQALQPQIQLVSGGAIAIIPDALQGAQLVWTYRRLSADTYPVYRRIDSTRLLNRGPISSGFDMNDGVALGDLRRELGAVDYRGTFGRGLRFGNSQNLVLDSRLDLQLDGDLGDGLSVSAVVSDQNIPLQPEGNTVQLQEFDRIFVTIAKDEHSLTAGDYSLRSSEDHFVRFDKNLQGLTYRYEQLDAATTQVSGRASLASARGQFQRIQLPVSDGNQGPYRLTGSRNQPFVIVLAGTERITLDGKLLERGIDRDYVIDYNRGEVTFMPRLLINRFQRILVEYEFVDREYLRTLVTAETDVKSGDWTFNISGLQQQDGLRRTGGDLSAEAEIALRDTPGGTAGTLVPSAVPLATGNANPIRYRAAVSSVDCNTDTIYIFDPAVPDDAALSVSFTELGPGAGDYRVLRTAGTNGVAFEYVARGDDCVPRGSYAALRLVQTPQALRLITLGGRFQNDSSSSVKWEVVGSQTDKNRYNPTANESMAGFAEAEKTWRIGAGRLTGLVNVEGTSDGFEAIAPWRDPEFKRLWNLGNLAQTANQATGTEQLASAAALYKINSTQLGYAGHYYAQEAAYTGFRQNWTARQKLGKWNLRHTGDQLAATRAEQATGKLQLDVGGARQGNLWQQDFGLNRLTTTNYDAVLDATTDVDREIIEWFASTTRNETDSTWLPSLTYRGRRDGKGSAGADDATGLNHQLELGLISPGKLRNGFTLTSTLRYTDAAASQTERYYLGRLSHRFRTRGTSWLRLQTAAEAGSGQERRVAIQYLKVQAGLGQYVWRDYNGDGIEDLGEFEIAVFADSASYLRTTLLTDEFVATNTLSVNQSVNLDFSRLSGAKGTWYKRFSAINTASMRRRATQASGFERLLAVSVNEADTTIVGDDLAWRSALYFNRARNAFRAEVEHRQLANRSISIQGLQQLRTNGLSLKLLQPLGEAWRITGEIERERRRSRGEGLEERNFTLVNRSIGPGLSYQPNTTIRLALTGTYREGEETGGDAVVVAREILFEADVRLAEQKADTEQPSRFAGATLTGSLRRVSQSFDGVADSPAGFALLEGLQPGKSWIWSMGANQQLGKALQLTLRYDGRQLGEGQVVHTGQAQLQAVF